MKKRVLSVQKSKLSIWDTGLSINGMISDETPSDEQAYEMKVDVYYDDSNLLPDRTIIIDEIHYEGNILKYGMEALLKGVVLDSLISVMEDSDDLFITNVDLISHSIIAKMEQDSFFNSYSPDKMRTYIRTKILSLKEKFDINPKK
jgi:hypothetical protein